MKVTLTKLQAEEVEHKIGILCDEPDLQAEYGLTAAQCKTLRNDIPKNGGEWVIPDGAEEAVVGEMQDHVVVLRDMAYDARKDGEIGQARQISRLATSLEKIFSVEESAMKDNIDKVVDQLVEGQGVNEDGSSGPYRYSLRHPKSSHPTRRFRASIYVDVWVPETDDLEADREVAKSVVDDFSAEIPNSYVGDVAYYRPHVTSGSPLDREL
jgi:hypothetical protein